MNNQKRMFVPIALVFIILNGLIIFTRSFLEGHGFDIDTLIYANALLFVITILGFFLQRRGIRSANPNAFVRSVYASIMLKMFICMIAVLIYVFLLRNKVNKPSLFASMGVYIVYTTVEVTALMKAARKKNA